MNKNNTILEIKKRSWDVKSKSDMPPGMYLNLHHGRKDPDEDLKDRGIDGPFIGPLKVAHLTYLSTINLSFIDDYETGPLDLRDGFGFHKDMIYYDDMYYGDFVLITHQ